MKERVSGEERGEEKKRNYARKSKRGIYGNIGTINVDLSIIISIIILISKGKVTSSFPALQKPLNWNNGSGEVSGWKLRIQIIILFKFKTTTEWMELPKMTLARLHQKMCVINKVKVFESE